MLKRKQRDLARVISTSFFWTHIFNARVWDNYYFISAIGGGADEVSETFKLIIISVLYKYFSYYYEYFFAGYAWNHLQVYGNFTKGKEMRIFTCVLFIYI